MSRRSSRILAVQALYAYDVGQASPEDLLELKWADCFSGEDAKDFLPNTADPCDFARILIAGTIEHLQTIDSKIINHLAQTWDFERLDRVTLAVLRVSVFEILYHKDLDSVVIIDEAIAISKLFTTDDSFRFVNAILDTISKEETI